MRDEDKTKEQLLSEVLGLRAQLGALTGRHSDVNSEFSAGLPTLLSLLSNSPDIITVLDPKSRLLYINRAGDGHRLEDVIGTHSTDYMPAEEKEPYLAMIGRVRESGVPESLEMSTFTEQGISTAWETRLVRLTNAQDEPFAVMGIGTDITPRKRAELALKESEAKLRAAVFAAGSALWKWDLKRNELVWDGDTKAGLGLDKEELPATIESGLDFVHPEDRERLIASNRRAISSGNYEDIEYRVVTPRGEIRHVFCKGMGVRDDSGELIAFLGGVVDVTERKRLEDQLRQSQKMEALGQLTAGIAHNFNNMLTVILSNVHLCANKAPENLRPRLRDAEHAAHRAADMVRELMMFARRYPAAIKRPIDLREVVMRTADICRTTFDKKFEIVVDVPEQNVNVAADPGQLEQVLLNICLNARDALTSVEHPRPRIELTLRMLALFDRNHGVELRVSDNGPGMPEDVRRRIFEPFFTTKEVGHGTGLGLATAYGIIIDHTGQIECESKPGEGATFVVRLPVTAASEGKVSVSSQNKAGHNKTDHDKAGEEKVGETILLIEDEDMVRRTTRAVLSGGGYRVLDAADGENGLAVYERERAGIDLVLLDWSMPRLSGERMLAELTKRNPNVKVVLFSGHSPVTDLPDNVRAVVQKPSLVESLLGTIRAALDD